MTDTTGKVSFLKEVGQRMTGGIKAWLDALPPQQRLHMVIGMFGILVVLLLLSILQTVRGIADRKTDTSIVIEHIDQPIVIGKVRNDYSPTNKKEDGRRKEGTGAGAWRGLGQLIPGGAGK